MRVVEERGGKAVGRTKEGGGGDGRSSRMVESKIMAGENGYHSEGGAGR